MLIVQTDAWIFKDELQKWCNMEYDYIGAPWCHLCKNVHNCNYEEVADQKSIVGNGGLSLRYIKKFQDVTMYLDPFVTSKWSIATSHPTNTNSINANRIIFFLMLNQIFK